MIRSERTSRMILVLCVLRFEVETFSMSITGVSPQELTLIEQRVPFWVAAADRCLPGTVFIQSRMGAMYESNVSSVMARRRKWLWIGTNRAASRRLPQKAGAITRDIWRSEGSGRKVLP